MKRLWFAFILLPLILFLTYFYFHFATNASIAASLNKIPQNALLYVDNKHLVTISQSERDAQTQNFIKHFFAPWHYAATPEQIAKERQDLLNDFKTFMTHPGEGPNTEAHPVSWVQSLFNNANTEQFPNNNENAIVIRDSSVRVLPTLEPSFTEFGSLSEGYPFDNLEQTYVATGTPLRILHTSGNKEWDYVIGDSFSGWIQDQDLAKINTDFIQAWEKGPFTITIKDNIPVADFNTLRLKSRVGMIYPASKSATGQLAIFVPIADASGWGKIEKIPVSSNDFMPFPLPFSIPTLANQANYFMGKPYGWGGGTYGYRDCSSTTRDLMADFGIWLPRNSKAQSLMGHTISLKQMNAQEKQNIILNYGVPFLTLIHMPGHIVLYVGKANGQAMIFNNRWGIHVAKFLNNDQDRIVLGKTVVTPIDFGKNFINVSSDLLSSADSMSVIMPSQDNSLPH